MFPVSSGFFKAIRNKAPQDIRLEFRNDDYTYGEVLTGKDIAVTAGGLTLTQVLNSATDIEFGRAVMAELKVTLINADGRFTDFNFNRQFMAKLGVYVTATEFYVGRTNNGMLGLMDAQGAMRIYDFDDGKVIARIYAEERTDYYLRDGADMDAATIIMWGSTLYVANSQGQLEGAFEIASDGETPEILPAPTEYPLGITEDDVLTWISEGVCVEVLEDTESEDGWEYIPLGGFKGERPESVRGKLIEFTAHDKMQLFDIPAADFITGLTFPCTLKQIFEKLCNFCRVDYISANDFENSGKTFDKNPFKHTDYTCREILAYIAEAAGAYAKMAPGDYAEFVYFTRYPEMPTFRRIDRFEMSESEFETPSISRLEVYSSYADQLNTSGTGDVVYGISDNPLLYAENADQAVELQPYVDAIYQRIARIDPYHPSSFRAEAHPAVECGDIIQVVNDYGETRRFPVFAQTLTWTGFAKATYENTGGVIRQNAPFTQRELEQLKKKSVKTKDLWTYIDSYLNSDEGVASINMAVGGKFVTEDQLSGFVTTSELNVGIDAYINGAEGIAKLTDSLSGVFVTTAEYDKSVHLTASSQVFVKAAGASSYSPSSITLTAETSGTGLTFAWYRNNAQISGATGKTLTVYPTDFTSSATYKVVATDSTGNTYSDMISLAKLADGATGATGPQGNPGVDGYTVLLSNEFIEVPVNASRKPLAASSYTCTVTVYKGLTALTATTGTPSASQFRMAVSSAPTGVTVTQKSANTLTISVSTATAISDCGYIVLSITSGSMTMSARIVVLANMNEQVVTVDARIEQKISDSSASILQTVSGTYATKSSLNNYSTTTQMNSAIEQKVNAKESSILSTVSANYATKSSLNNYSTTTQMESRIAQEVNALGASLTLSVTNGEKSSVIKLLKSGVSISSQTIEFKGDVVFKSDLSTAGSTTINGANISTDNLYVRKIYGQSGTNWANTPIVSSNGKDVAIGNGGSDGYSTNVTVWANNISFASRSSYNSDQYLVISTVNSSSSIEGVIYKYGNCIYPYNPNGYSTSGWYIGNEDHPFVRGYFHSLWLYDSYYDEWRYVEMYRGELDIG